MPATQSSRSTHRGPRPGQIPFFFDVPTPILIWVSRISCASSLWHFPYHRGHTSTTRAVRSPSSERCKVGGSSWQWRLALLAGHHDLATVRKRGARFRPSSFLPCSRLFRSRAATGLDQCSGCHPPLSVCAAAYNSQAVGWFGRRR